MNLNANVTIGCKVKGRVVVTCTQIFVRVKRSIYPCNHTVNVKWNQDIGQPTIIPFTCPAMNYSEKKALYCQVMVDRGKYLIYFRGKAKGGYVCLIWTSAAAVFFSK